jgi:hypothetical protein
MTPVMLAVMLARNVCAVRQRGPDPGLGNPTVARAASQTVRRRPDPELAAGRRFDRWEPPPNPDHRSRIAVEYEKHNSGRCIRNSF